LKLPAFRRSEQRDAYVSSDLHQFPGDAGYWVEGQPSTRWAIQFNSIRGGPADAHSVAVQVSTPVHAKRNSQLMTAAVSPET